MCNLHRYEELQFDISEYYGRDHIWRKGRDKEPRELKISMHMGQLEEMFAMGTVDFGDLQEIVCSQLYQPVCFSHHNCYNQF